MDIDKFAHCRRASRPSLVWLELCLLARKYDLDDGVIQTIHNHVCTSMPQEKDGLLSFMDRKRREEAERVARGAEKAMPFYRIVGFKTLNGFLSHVHMEKKAEEARELDRAAEHVKFGFETRGAFARARIAERKRLRTRSADL